MVLVAVHMTKTLVITKDIILREHKKKKKKKELDFIGPHV
jgi:hypothetical protein